MYEHVYECVRIYMYMYARVFEQHHLLSVYALVYNYMYYLSRILQFRVRVYDTLATLL